jgi:DNA-binding LacI/PurR family transcriptional regulator
VNMKEIAQKAGVSIATVSRVINNHSAVGANTRNRVLEAANALGYDEKIQAKASSFSSNNIISIILHDIQKTFYYDLLMGFQRHILDTEYEIIFSSRLDKQQELKSRNSTMFWKGISAGTIVFSSYATDIETIKSMMHNNYPLVLIDNDIHSEDVNRLLVKNRESSEKVIEYLYSIGHRKIACLAGSPNLMVWVERLNGYIKAMQKNRMRILPGYIQYANNDEEGVPEAAYSFLSMDKSVRPTAIYCFNDTSAYIAISTIQKMGFEVPRDVSVVGYDCNHFAPTNYNGPTLTSIHQPFDEIAKDSIQIVINSIQQKRAGHKMQVVTKWYETDLVVNQSTAPPSL